MSPAFESLRNVAWLQEVGSPLRCKLLLGDIISL